MMHKSERLHKMLSYIGLYLLVAVIAESHGYFRVEPNAYLKLDKAHNFLNETSEIAPDILDDGHFVAALSVRSPQGLPGLSIQIIGPPPNATKSKCFVPFVLAVNTSAHPIRRLSRKTVLLTVIDRTKKEMKLVLMNTNNCKYTDVYDAVLPESHYIFTNDDPTDEKFTLIIYGKDFCRGHNWCRLFFDPLYRKFESLDFDFHWKKYDVDIQSATTFDGNVFVTRFTDERGIYRIRMYNVTSTWATFKHQDLFSITPHFTRDNYENMFPWWHPYTTRYYYYDVQDNVRSSGLSHCWLRYREDNYIACSVYRKDGSMMFKFPMFASYLSRILQVKPIPNGLILFSKVQDCIVSSWKSWTICQQVRVSVIRCDNCTNSTVDYTATSAVQVKRTRHQFECDNVEGLKVRMNDTDNTVRVEYLCNWFLTMSYHVLNIDLNDPETI